MRRLLAIGRIVVCVLLALATLELLARLEDHIRYEAPVFGPYDITRLLKNDRYGVVGRPNARYRQWKTNALGLHGPLPRSATVRIACVGASETYGIGEDENRDYPRQLENRLTQMFGTPSIEVVNLGIVAATFHQIVQRLPETAERYHPAFVTIYPSPASYIFWEAPHPPQAQESSAPPPTLRTRVTGKLAFELRRWVSPGVLHFGRRCWNRLRRVDPGDSRIREKVDAIAIRSFPPDWVVWWRERTADRKARNAGLHIMDRIPEDTVDVFRTDLRTAVEFWKNRGVPVVLATHAHRFGDAVLPEERSMLAFWRSFYPPLRTDGFLDMEDRMNAVIRSVAADQGVPLVDAARLVPPGPTYFFDFVHFTNKGSEIMAASLAEKLAPLLEQQSAERVGSRTTTAMTISH